MEDDTATAAVTGCARVFDLHALKAFAPEPGQSTVMHQHLKEEEAISSSFRTPSCTTCATSAASGA